MALYLKYRPKDFENLVWQDFINKTLKQAIKTDKTVWAYLLCGPRGTWKTSTARILAKGVNCLDLQNWNPCNKCEICMAINTESLVDVIEIDAASNTWVDNIREIISKANFRPTNAKFKVYIIDEVHMLSKWAFNALLKILEEPPSFVKFILATTETHKVPDTIISRCQRYDFKNISNPDLKNRLEFIAKNEKIKIDVKALDYIVNSSNGWARNAISLFEQLIVENEVTYENIEKNMGISSKDFLESFLKKLLGKNANIIDELEWLSKSWKNVKLFFKDLIFFTKNKAIEELKENKQISEYINILEILDDTYSRTKNSIDENTTFLIWVLKIIDISKTQPAKLSEKRIEPILVKEAIKKESQKSLDQEIKKEDIWDIFWEKEENVDLWEKKEGSSIFDKKELTKILKELWAKWWLTMWIRWAECYNNWECLEIKFKTAFALKQTNNTENIDLINKWLEKMNMWNLKLNLV